MLRSWKATVPFIRVRDASRVPSKRSWACRPRRSPCRSAPWSRSATRPWGRSRCGTGNGAAAEGVAGLRDLDAVAREVAGAGQPEAADRGRRGRRRRDGRGGGSRLAGRQRRLRRTGAAATAGDDARSRSKGCGAAGVLDEILHGRAPSSPSNGLAEYGDRRLFRGRKEGELGYGCSWRQKRYGAEWSSFGCRRPARTRKWT